MFRYSLILSEMCVWVTKFLELVKKKTVRQVEAIIEGDHPFEGWLTRFSFVRLNLTSISSLLLECDVSQFSIELTKGR